MISQHILIKDSSLHSGQKPVHSTSWQSYSQFDLMPLFCFGGFLSCNINSLMVSVAVEDIPFLSTCSLHGDFLSVDNQQALQVLEDSGFCWAQMNSWIRTLWGFPIPLPTPMFLSVDGHIEVDSWAFSSNSLADAMPVPGTNQGLRLAESR